MRQAIKYLNNAREILKKAKKEGNVYLEIKPVREAFGTAYLAVLEAINEKLIEKGFTKKQLPKSVDGYREMLKKYFLVYNGKILREFDMLYDGLHIAGYYRGLIYNVKAVKDLIDATESFIKKLR